MTSLAGILIICILMHNIFIYQHNFCFHYLLDSKTLNEQQREVLMKRIQDSADHMGYKIEILSPNYIANSMLRRYNIRTCLYKITKININNISIGNSNR